MVQSKKVFSFYEAFLPIGMFFMLLIYGLFIHPQIFKGDQLPVAVLVLMALSFNAFYLMKKGISWEEIQQQINDKVGESVPIILILFSVGVLIGSWIVSGTIPMLIYHGISLVSPDWIYIFSFLICIVFSLLTGTSWGSAGTIGVVMIGIAQVYGANQAVTAAAIVGGSFFGDKMSPLSDTTNIAALVTNIPVYDHIKSMIYTTGPAAILAALVYVIMSPVVQGNISESAGQIGDIEATLIDLKSIFNFNIALLLPLVIVLVGSWMRKPIVLTLLTSAWVAMILALIFQEFTLNDIFNSFNSGFTTDMAGDVAAQSKVLNILNRGGLYNLIDGVTISLLVFAFIGTLEVVDAIDITIDRVMKDLKKRTHIVTASLMGTLVTNLTISNQYATSFVIGAAMNKKFDDAGIPRKVLSRSIEDAGTMMENLLPWTPSGLFMINALGVSSLEYAPYQFLSLFNIVIAFFFAMTGIACFFPKEKQKLSSEGE